MVVNNRESTGGTEGGNNDKKGNKDKVSIKEITCEEQRELSAPFRDRTDEELMITLKHFNECSHCGKDKDAPGR